MAQLTALFLVVLWVVVATYADMQFKATKELWSPQFALGFAGYAATSFIAVATFRHQSWGWIFIVWSVMAIGVGLALSVLVYHEPMTWRRAVAAAMLVGTMFLVE